MCLARTGCGNGATDSAASSQRSGGESSAGSSVQIKDLAYSPSNLEVAAGSTVTWTNSDGASHTVTFDGDAVEDSDQLKKGDAFEATFDEAGSYSYVCAFTPT